ncbi:transport SEC31-like isoform X2, putative [Babesia ovata]|uniref:Transport SEC31-like isoform X2, putative n=1 Tax=Babesia ovata TaxID=189622 RepID=A0A2H6KC40_9APIC|nr:transport SEC31-like isoform X2, putative [Babesia ovata]GBE60552.1 transport SEC31-like isoform X2, putative [Babesia ovata]
MKGLGVFSPFAATSRCILTAPCYDDACGGGSPRPDANQSSLSLIGFEIKERAERPSSAFDLSFDANNNFNGFANENPFGGSINEFGSYDSGRYGAGIADFTTYHTADIEGLDGKLTSLTWMECSGENGIVGVGATSGDLILLDGTTIVEGDAPRVISKTRACNTPLRRLSYNAKTNMLGIAGIDGQISVCDLGNSVEPKVLDVSYGKWHVGLVTGLSWNKRLGHILATSGAAVGPSGAMSPSDSSGLVVWDLKARKPASSFRDPSGRMQPIAVEWMSEHMTQLIVGYGDDKSPALQLWDLRNCTVPLKEVRGHTMGLTSLSICPHDANLLLTSGRDDHTCCWTLDSVNGPFHPLGNMQTGALSHHRRIQWHPTAPGFFLAQDTDDDLSVHSAMCMSQTESYMPAWTRRTCGVISGFASSVTTWTSAGVVNEYKLGSELDDDTAKALEDSLELFCELANTDNFGAICKDRAASVTDEFDKLTWEIMGALHSGEPAALVNTLGYKLPEPKDEAVTQDQFAEQNDAPQPQLDEKLDGFGGEPLNEEDGEAFFSSLANKESSLTEEPLAQSLSIDGHESEPPMSDEAPSTPTGSYLSWGEAELCSRVIVGDYEAAAQLCLDKGKLTEALFLAYAGGLDLWLKVSDAITEKAQDPLLRALHLVMKGDVRAMVMQCPLDKWREVLVYVITNMMGDRDAYRDLCNVLGHRLYESFKEGNKKDLLPASIMFMCSGDVSRVIDCWKHLETGKNNIELVAKSAVRAAALWISVADDISKDHLGRSATMLAEAFVECGDVDKAVKCLSLPFVARNPHATELLSRIRGTGHPGEFKEAPVQRRDPAPVAPAQTQVPAKSAVRGPTEFGTAPAAVANAVYPGMPVPWPLPTATQQMGSSTRSTEDANRRIIATSAAVQPQGERMVSTDLQFVTTVLSNLIAQGDTSRAAQDNRRRIADLMTSLSNGEHSAEANGLILNMCRAIHAGDRINANIILSTISTKLWSTANKNWIMCLKRIVPK